MVWRLRLIVDLNNQKISIFVRYKIETREGLKIGEAKKEEFDERIDGRVNERIPFSLSLFSYDKNNF